MAPPDLAGAAVVDLPLAGEWVALTMPHLHFQLMDGPDPLTAQGRLCAFRDYRRRDAEDWQPVAVGLPGLMERFESLPRASASHRHSFAL